MFRNIKNVKFFAKGKRSNVYVGFYKRKKVAIKVERGVKGIIRNESKWLKILNKYGIGPKLFICKNNYIVYEFVEGEPFSIWLKKSNKNNIRKVIKKILLKIRILDKLMVNKEEMHKPYKHILVGKEPKLIDFERCKKTKKPKNVTQFCQYLMSNNVYNILKKKGILFDKKDLIKLLKDYKIKRNERLFKKILKRF